MYRGGGSRYLLSQSVFDSAAWYLLTYTNTLSFSEWRVAVKQTYADLEAKFGLGATNDHLSKMVAYYCMEIAPGPMGRKAASRFRKVHTWADYRSSDVWWLDEWKNRRRFDLQVERIKKRLAEIPSIAPENIDHDHWSREALRIILSYAENRIRFDKRTDLNNLETIEACARITISTFGGWAVYALCEHGILTDREKIPSLQTMYFVERALVVEYGEALTSMKTKEYV